MAEYTLPANMIPQTEPTDSEQAAQQAPLDQVGLSDSQMQPSQRGPLTKPAAPGRMPLFRR
jgi:hypothetical protein